MWSLSLQSWAEPESASTRRPRAWTLSLRRDGHRDRGRVRTHDMGGPQLTTPVSSLVSRTGRGQRRLPLRVRLRRQVLDREIAAGLRPDEDRARALRAQQLVGAPERQGIAACLENILDAADERHADPAPPLALNHAEVLAARHEIVALMDLLCSERTVTARGVARARVLTEPRSPLLRPHTGRSARQAVAEAIAALYP